MQLEIVPNAPPGYAHGAPRAHVAHGAPGEAIAAPRSPYALDEVVLRHLKSVDEIATVMHLREEIDLSAHTASGRHFIHRVSAT